jgi:regulator of protease activity HflC (stomatin/prohibitin superfamily)
MKFAVGACILAFILFVGGCNYFASFDAPRPGYAAVCQTGGPIQGDSGTCGVLQRGSGKRMIGYENKLIEFPATQRTFLFADHTNNADAPSVEVPLADGNVVRVKTQIQFTLNQDSGELLSFYKAYGTRSFGGPKAADHPDEWWSSFLANQMRPTAEGAYREVMAPYRCADVNPSCDLDKLNEQLQAKKNNSVAKVDPSKEKQKGQAAAANLSTIANAVQDNFTKDIKNSLHGDYLTGIRVKIFKADPPPEVSGEIQRANAAKARLVTAIADSQANVQRETGRADAAEQEARGRRALSKAYAKNSALAQIEIAKALCGETGCQNLQVLGSNSNLFTQLKK